MKLISMKTGNYIILWGHCETWSRHRARDHRETRPALTRDKSLNNHLIIEIKKKKEDTVPVILRCLLDVRGIKHS